MNPILKPLLFVAFSVIFIASGRAQVKFKKHMQAKGTFEVKISPVEGTSLETEAGVGRMTIDKTWHGDLSGSSKGTMLSTAVEATGAMAYVALEKVDATLNSKKGSFYFSHNATMNKTNPKSAKMNITVVPGSATGELIGLSGLLTIIIDKVAHSYVFDYELP